MFDSPLKGAAEHSDSASKGCWFVCGSSMVFLGGGALFPSHPLLTPYPLGNINKGCCCFLSSSHPTQRGGNCHHRGLFLKIHMCLFSLQHFCSRENPFESSTIEEKYVMEKPDTKSRWLPRRNQRSLGKISVNSLRCIYDRIAPTWLLLISIKIGYPPMHCE